MNDKLRRFLEEYLEKFKAEDISLFIYRGSSFESQLELVIALKHTKMEGIAVTKDMGIVGWVALHCEPVLSNNPKEDERFMDVMDLISGHKTHSIIAVPIVYEGVVIGVIEIFNKHNNARFTKSDLKIAQKAAEQIVKYIPEEKLKKLEERKKLKN